MNHAKSVGLDQFDEHAVVSNFCNHRGKLGSLRLIQFPFEKFEQLDFDRLSLGFRAIHFSVAKVFGQGIGSSDGVASCRTARKWFATFHFLEIMLEYPVDNRSE